MCIKQMMHISTSNWCAGTISKNSSVLASVKTRRPLTKFLSMKASHVNAQLYYKLCSGSRKTTMSSKASHRWTEMFMCTLRPRIMQCGTGTASGGGMCATSSTRVPSCRSFATTWSRSPWSSSSSTGLSPRALLFAYGRFIVYVLFFVLFYINLIYCFCCLNSIIVLYFSNFYSRAVH